MQNYYIRDRFFFQNKDKPAQNHTQAHRRTTLHADGAMPFLPVFRIAQHPSSGLNSGSGGRSSIHNDKGSDKIDMNHHSVCILVEKMQLHALEAKENECSTVKLSSQVFIIHFYYWQLLRYLLRNIPLCGLHQWLSSKEVKNLLAMQEMQGTQETQVRSLGWEGFLEEGMATHPSILAQRIPRTEKLDELQSKGLQRVGHNGSN